nr:hypothetical protein [Tanacetum cinerariifolium]
PNLQSDLTISPLPISSPSRIPIPPHDSPLPGGRKIPQIDKDEGITLVQMGAQTQGRNEHEVESNFNFTTTEDISTANVPVTTAGAEISTNSPEDKTTKTSNDSDDITLAET